MAEVQGKEVTIKTVSSPFTLWIRVREWYDTSTGKWRPKVEKITMNSSGWYGWTYYLDGTVAVNGTTIFSPSSYNGSHGIGIYAQNTNVSLENVATGSWITRALCSSTGASASVSINLRIHTTDGGGGSGTAFTNSGTLSLTTTAHNYTNTVTAPTCTAQGYTTHKCKMCSYSYKDTYTAAKGHTNVNGGTSAIHTKCSVCGATTSTAHSYTVDSGVQYTAATCTAPRYNYKKCSCGYNPKSSSYTVATGAALGHKSVYGGTKDIHTKCSTCGVTLSSTHSYSSSVKIPAKCASKGTTQYDCGCGYSYTSQDIAALGHNYVGTVIDPTCTAQGYTSYKCSRCSDTTKADDTFTAALGHNYKGTIIDPTCTTQGYTSYKCARCSDTSKANDTYTAALGHEYESEILEAPTYTKPGTMNYSCIRCDDYYTEAIARKRGAVQINTATGHRPHLAYVRNSTGWVLCVPNVHKSNNEWNPCG